MVFIGDADDDVVFREGWSNGRECHELASGVGQRISVMYVGWAQLHKGGERVIPFTSDRGLLRRRC
jgi:hypothetical protein